MNFLDLAKKRRSCRNYSSRRVSRESIERCIEAARWAPSACNSQPWHFIVVEDPRLKDSLGQGAFSGIHSFNGFARSAPILVVFIRERAKYAAELGGLLQGICYSLIDLGIACEHFVLQAEEEGLGTCWLGWFNERAVKKILRLSRRTKVDIILSVGYPGNGEKEGSTKERKSFEQVCEFR